MRKSLIAGAGVAAFGFAAMPILGVFASTSTMTDTIQVTIGDACTLVTSGTSDINPSNTYAVTMTPGTVNSTIGSAGTGSATNKIDVSCNTSTGNTWQLTAVGAGEGATVDVMKPAGSGSTAIASGTATSGATSNWAMKVEVASGVTQNNFATFSAVPTSTTTVATGSGSITNAFTMLYQVYIAPDQTADTYTGKVLYTLTNPAP